MSLSAINGQSLILNLCTITLDAHIEEPPFGIHPLKQNLLCLICIISYSSKFPCMKANSALPDLVSTSSEEWASAMPPVSTPILKCRALCAQNFRLVLNSTAIKLIQSFPTLFSIPHVIHSNISFAILISSSTFILTLFCIKHSKITLIKFCRLTISNNLLFFFFQNWCSCQILTSTVISPYIDARYLCPPDNLSIHLVFVLSSINSGTIYIVPSLI